MTRREPTQDELRAEDDVDWHHSYAGAAFVTLTDEQQLSVIEYVQTHHVSIEKALAKVLGDEGICTD